MAYGNITIVKIRFTIIVVYGLVYANCFQQCAYRKQFDTALWCRATPNSAIVLIGKVTHRTKLLLGLLHFPEGDKGIVG